MVWLSIVTFIASVILLSLAYWQYQRLHWKTQLLARVERAVKAEPITDVQMLIKAIEQGTALDFRRVELPANLLENSGVKYVFASQSGGIYWQAFAPIRLGAKSKRPIETDISLPLETDSEHKTKSEHKTGGNNTPVIIYANLGAIKEQARSDYQRPDLTHLIGYIRFDHPMGTIESWVKSKANAAENRYFKFNQSKDWFTELPAPYHSIKPYYIEHINGAGSAKNLPIKRPKIRNNHLSYMFTWLSFAVILWIIYAILHVRVGRLHLAHKVPNDG